MNKLYYERNKAQWKAKALRFSGMENRTVGSDCEDRKVFGQSDTRS